MNRPLFSILHTTARPGKWQEAYREWIAKAVNPENVEYVLCVDERWGFTYADGERDAALEFWNADRPLNRLVWNEGPKTAVSGWNTAAAASTGHVLLVSADDFFACQYWDAELTRMIFQGVMGGAKEAFARDFAIRVSDGTPADQQGHMCHAFLSRARYEHQGGVVYHPEYHGVFCDNDFTAHARQDGVIIDASHLRFDHRHPGYRMAGGFSRENKGLDEAWWHHNKPEDYEHGRRIFEKRQRERFGHGTQSRQKSIDIPARSDGPIPDSGAPGRALTDNEASARACNAAPLVHDPEEVHSGASNRIHIGLCWPGEHFRGEFVDTLLTLYDGLIDRNYGVYRLRDYTSNVYVTRANMWKAMRGLDPHPDAIMWLDDDNIMTPEQFDLLVQGLNAHPEVDGVAGWCWIHDFDKREFHVSCGMWSPDHISWNPFSARSFPQEHALRPFECGGFPAFLMRWSAVEKWVAFSKTMRGWETGANEDNPFLPILDSRLPHGIAGEDMSYFRHAEDAGCKFLVDPRVRVRHLKYVEVEPVFEPIPENLPEPRIAGMVRAKNEGRWIDRCVKSLLTVCDAGVFLMDDGSTDDTVRMALRAAENATGDDQFHIVPVPDGPRDRIDESYDKNWLLQRVKDACAPDWVLCIDGDEELEPDAAFKIRTAVKHAKVDCYGLRFLHLWDRPDQIRVDRWYSNFTRLSLFKPIGGYKFQSLYKDQGVNCHSGLHTGNAPYGMQPGILNVFLLHYGYMLKEDRLRKYEYYNRIDPNNEQEDCYRHTVQGDIPEVPKEAVLKHAGPLELRTLPARLVPNLDAKALVRMEVTV